MDFPQFFDPFHIDGCVYDLPPPTFGSPEPFITHVSMVLTDEELTTYIILSFAYSITFTSKFQPYSINPVKVGAPLPPGSFGKRSVSDDLKIPAALNSTTETLV